MKNKIFHFIALSTAAITMVGCVDTEIDGISATQLDSLANLSYLKEYGSLKEYVNRSENPDFKLGAGVAASSFINSNLEYRVVAANFDEVTAGNAMKYASCVSDDGSMDFGTVMDFVDKARESGISIYGHTLAWHSQQNNKYLNSLLQDKELPPSSNVRTCLKINNPNAANQWDAQLHFNLTSPMKAGSTYVLKMTAKASTAYTLDIWGYEGDNGLTVFNISTDFADYEAEFTAAKDFKNLVFALGRLGGDMFVDKISLTEKGSDENMIENGDFDDTKVPCFKNYGWHGFTFEITEVAESSVTEIPVEVERRCIKVSSQDMVEVAWETQFWIVTDATFSEGDSWEVSMDVRADKAASAGTQVHAAPGAYLHWAAIGTVPFTKKWTTYTASGKIEGAMAGGHSIAFNLNDFKDANNYYFDNISFKLNGVELIKNSSCDDDNMKDNYVAKEAPSSNPEPATFIDKYTEMQSSTTLPLTPEEKKDTLTWAMSNWINGMMEACGGYVNTWDVVNEAIAGVDKDGDGYYDLQSATRNTVSEADKADNFYWQDYLGDVDYVRTAVKLAREAYAANGGEGALKLFINDYNLESDWDQNKKVKSLVEHWIPLWEEDGTKIDGIGSQMHVSCFENEATMQSKKNAVVEMFKILASSKKLIKISELDMGYIDAAGNNVKTENLTDEQAKQMAEYYKFIIEQYFANIPAEQRYGITQWALTDSPDGSGWRGGEPIGLWTQKWDRKRTFGGFADGLIGK